MNRYQALWIWLIVFATGCAGTGTGNPGEDDNNQSNIVVPVGAELIKSDEPRASNVDASDTQIKSLGEGNRAFTFNLYAELSKEGKNLFFSPFSISMALAMTYAGAEGDTENEMRDVLHFSLPEPDLHAAFNATDQTLKARADELPKGGQGDGFELSIVNQAWGQKGYKFLDKYLDVLAINYGAGLFLIDFAQSESARKLINDWVADQTKERIKDLLPEDSIDSLTRLVLTNAIYFKASWLSKFDPSNTADGAFRGATGEQTVPMMHQTVDTRYFNGDSYQAVELPYLSDKIRMLILLPADGQFESVSGGMNEELFQQVTSGLSSYMVTLTMPRFSFESENKLAVPLQALGMETAFSGNADFSGIDGTHNLYVDEVYHKAFVAVDEQGTEAAAATAVVIRTKAMKPSAEVVLDRPFIFLIYDQPTGQILFLGHVKDITS